MIENEENQTSSLEHDQQVSKFAGLDSVQLGHGMSGLLDSVSSLVIFSLRMASALAWSSSFMMQRAG